MVLYVTVAACWWNYGFHRLINLTRTSRGCNDGRYRNGRGRWRWDNDRSWRSGSYWIGFDGCVGDRGSLGDWDDCG